MQNAGTDGCTNWGGDEGGSGTFPEIPSNPPVIFQVATQNDSLKLKYHSFAFPRKIPQRYYVGHSLCRISPSVLKTLAAFLR